MRQFPQVTLILLLFLIAALLGSLVWLQWSAHLGQSDENRGARVDHTRQGRGDAEAPGPDSEQSNPPANEPEARRDLPGGRSTAPEAADTVEVEATTQQEPRRPSPESELKPDLEQIARDDAKAVAEAQRLANLEATFARGAVAEQARDGLDLRARTVWAVPPLSTLGSVTASYFNAHYCGPMERHPQAAKEAARRLGKASVSAKEARELFGDEWVLVGQVKLPPTGKDRPDPWAGLDRPPILVRGLGKTVVANAQGWFALVFLKAEWAKDQAFVDADFPGCELVDTAGHLARVRLDDKPESQAALTLALTAVPMLSVKVDYKPAQSMRSGLRAWLEVRRAPREQLQPENSQISLFLEADVPASGQLTFMLPDPRTWTLTDSGGASIRVAAGGDGWASGTPMVITNWDVKEAREAALRRGVKFLAIKTSLTLDRASTDLVTGRFTAGKADRPGSPVRVESSHTGAVTWSEMDGSFKLWTQLDRGNWKQKLIVEPTYAPAFSFFIDYDSQRPPNVELRKGASAPTGPWDVKLPTQTGGLMYLAVPKSRYGLDICLQTADGWLPLLITKLPYGTGGNGSLLLCSNWPDWHDEAVVVDRETGRVQRARLEPYQILAQDFYPDGQAQIAKGQPIAAMQVVELDD